MWIAQLILSLRARVVGSARFESQNPFRVLAGKKERKMSLAISGGKGAPRAKKTTD
jgi:hypothetical protein